MDVGKKDMDMDDTMRYPLPLPYVVWMLRGIQLAPSGNKHQSFCLVNGRFTPALPHIERTA